MLQRIALYDGFGIAKKESDKMAKFGWLVHVMECYHTDPAHPPHTTPETHPRILVVYRKDEDDVRSATDIVKAKDKDRNAPESMVPEDWFDDE